MIPFSERAVEGVYDSYPESVRSAMFALRDLIYTSAQKLGGAGGIMESLKWGEPSYKSRSGSALRIHWKRGDPEFFRMFFHCQTSLVETFREIYPDVFDYEGNRAIRFKVGDEIDLVSLGHCVELALSYHSIKHLPRLGVNEILANTQMKKNDEIS
ncbi:MAG: DUF1801 domain-containing protein [Akkermansiaceae bacterium]